jgi:hypothetical protein
MTKENLKTKIGIVTEGTCSCSNPRPYHYLSSRQTARGLEDIHRCDSCSKQIYSLRVPAVIREER